MGRKDYQADLRAVIAAALPENFLELAPGDDDGSFNFTYRASNSNPVTFTALIPELSDYPKDHSYMVFTTSDNVPNHIQSSIEHLELSGIRIASMLEKLSTQLDGGEDDVSMTENDNTQEYGQEEEEEEEEEEDDWYSDPDLEDSQSAPQTDSRRRLPEIHRKYTPQETVAIDARIRSDVLHLKKAGFRVACASGNSFLMVSIRISRLNIQEDTLKAWDLKNEEYLMLVIHYRDGYRPMEEIGATTIGQNVVLRVVLSNNYKIPLNDLINVCSDTESTDTSNTRELFIGRPLDELLSKRLGPIIRYRTSMNLSWRGAEDYFNDHQSIAVKAEAVNEKYYVSEEQIMGDRLPEIAKADHLTESGKPYSFPLLAMQFTLRHMVRCTEFCLVCHCHIDAGFEALRPYVCSKSLCLYQYMTLGFGPSIEHEIITQPHVVDLLVSFCFAAARSGSLQSTPTGMGLTVSQSMLDGSEDIQAASLYRRTPYQSAPQTPQNKPLPPNPSEVKKEVDLDVINSEFVFGNQDKDPKLYVGQWVEIITVDPHRSEQCKSDIQHRRVMEVFWPIVRLSPPYKCAVVESAGGYYDNAAGARNNLPPPVVELSPVIELTEGRNKAQLQRVHYRVWNTNFDDLDRDTQQAAIVGLLCLLPSMQEMISYLQSVPEKKRDLRKWTNRIPPAALGVLRWIIASNRSCIVQIESLDQSKSLTEDKVSGMRGYMQFRFASGAPDKEQRFIDAVNGKAKQLSLKHPTLFAWHGSPLGNWHGIVREGLNFDRTLHGRSFGDGVYNSLDMRTSEGYCRSGAVNYWPGSQLGITGALCLNEIVNAPAEFRSHNPHLVVQHTDWIQTRYLFVSCAKRTTADTVLTPTEELELDPKMRPNDNTGKKIAIPLAAISKSRRPSYGAHGQKRTKLSSGVEIDKQYTSDSSDAEDLALTQNQNHSQMRDINTTAFEPGKLARTTLPLLAQPTYATTNATKALQRELKKTLALQESQPQQELGWYIDAAAVENLYQWIFEIHSFDKSLPLAKDMEKYKVQSVVLELRFGRDFPFSPPFVRVIRPRFLPFLQGGGGHVTAGGALCMELLTNSGWNPASSVEAILLQVRMALTSTDPKPARLQPGQDYGALEAKQAYERACQAHGWQIPKDLHEMTDMQPVISQGPSRRGWFS